MVSETTTIVGIQRGSTRMFGAIQQTPKKDGIGVTYPRVVS